LAESLEYLLMELGLTALEADAYLVVLAEPDSTGYRISQALGKPAPNIYKALDSLVTKGAVLADEGSRSRTFTAVSVREQIIQKSSRLEELGYEIEMGLKSLNRPDSGKGIYRLNSVHQVVAKAQEMINRSVDIIVADADNGPIQKFSEYFQKAAERGVKVLLHGRAPMEVPGCEFISSVTEGWEGDMLVIISDQREYLISFMSKAMHSLIGGIWSRNFVAPCLYRGYMVKALFYRIVMMLGNKSTSPGEIRTEVLRLWESWGYDDSGREALKNLLTMAGD
jgi:hypothetical protein